LVILKRLNFVNTVTLCILCWSDWSQSIIAFILEYAERINGLDGILMLKNKLLASVNINKRQIKNFLKYHKDVRMGKEKISSLFSDSDFKDVFGNAMSAEDNRRWKKAFLYYNRFRPQESSVIAEHLLFENVKLVKDCKWGRLNPEDPILICNVKDDLERLKMLVRHHRKLGVMHFAILDNCSSDGTFEWIMEQPDIDVYKVEEKYNSIVRAAWILKIALHYGMDRWYIIVDSDELLVYDRMEEENIQQFIKKLEKRGLHRSLGFMVDMYAMESDMLHKQESEDIFSRYCFFDKNTYQMKKGELAPVISGGPRERVFGKCEDGYTEVLTKYPVFFWKKGEIYRYHFACPFLENFRSPLCVWLLHYKFLDGDMEKYKQIVRDGNYAGGSVLYKRCVEQIGDSGMVSFMYDGSTEFRQSSDIKKIHFS